MAKKLKKQGALTQKQAASLAASAAWKKKLAASKRRKKKTAQSQAMGIAAFNQDTFAQQNVFNLSLTRGGLTHSFKTAPARVSEDVSSVAAQLEAQMRDFFVSLQLAPQVAGEIFANVVGSTFGKIIQRTPVDTGHARSGWRLTKTIDKPDEKSYRITNTVPYVVYLEYGWSRQAPAGMVRVSLLEAGRGIKEALGAYIRG